MAVDGNGNIIAVWRTVARAVMTSTLSVGRVDWPTRRVYPDLFYFPIGVAQSRTVDTLSGNIAVATLMANNQTNGGTIQFCLTNNGGMTWVSVTPGVTHVFTTTSSGSRLRAVLIDNPTWPCLRASAVYCYQRCGTSAHLPPASQATPIGSGLRSSSAQNTS